MASFRKINISSCAKRWTSTVPICSVNLGSKPHEVAIKLRHSYSAKTSTRDSLTCHVEDAVTGSDVGQEGVPQALAGMGSLHQARNVHHIEECWDLAAKQEVKTIKTLTGIH